MKKVTTYLFAAFCALAAAGLVPSAAQAAVVLDLSPEGKLLGARNVDVGGTLYDVTFVTGSCVALFNGCDEDSDFAFHDFATAVSAAQALLDQVLLDGPLGNFDSDPALTNGCSSSIACQIAIPVVVVVAEGTFITGAEAINFTPSELEDRVDPGRVNPGHDRPFPFAIFTPAVAVSEPASALLLGTGLIGAIALGRRGRRANTRADIVGA